MSEEEAPNTPLNNVEEEVEEEAAAEEESDKEFWDGLHGQDNLSDGPMDPSLTLGQTSSIGMYPGAVSRFATATKGGWQSLIGNRSPESEASGERMHR